MHEVGQFEREGVVMETLGLTTPRRDDVPARL